MIADKDDAMAVLEKTRAKFLAHVRAEAVKLALKNNGSATVDDIHEVCPVPKDMDGRVLGAAFSDRGRWKPAGFVRSRRPICHGRHIQVFHLIGFDQAHV